MAAQAIVELQRVSKSYHGVPALRDVSFDLLPGEVHALLGENGAGKSTLIKVITGAHPPDGGAMKMDGREVRHLTPATARGMGIACVYQQPALFPDLTVAENLSLRLEPASAARLIDWPSRRTRAGRLLHRIGAAISPDAEIRSLSMPEQQLVEIACVLGAGARVVVMDEPTASLTQKEVQLLFGVVRELQLAGVGIIYISHRLEEIFAIANRVTVLRDGASLGTYPVDSVNEASLIRLMVGREVSAMAPPAEAAPGENVLSLKEIGCATSGISHVTLDVRAREVVGLAGLVGAGRTELARVLFGITPADTGEILMCGRALSIRSPQEAIASGIGYVPEDRRRHGVILDMAIAANISMAIHPRLFPYAWLRFAAERRLAFDYIRDLDIRTAGAEVAAAVLSGGNQQKVALARWLATCPKLLILDEPTQGVDVGAKAEIHKIIRRLTKEGMAVLMISSDLPEILGMSDRIAVMRGGTVTTVLAGNADPHEIMAAALGQAGKGTEP